MITVEQMRNVAQDLISSYDARVDAIGTIIDKTYQILEDFKDKRAKLSAELKETLAKKESLRKKDFDRMMNGILLDLERKEKEIKQSLKNFLKEQKNQAFELKHALTKGEVERMKKAQIEIENGIAWIKGLLKNFCEQQEELTEKLRKLLSKGNNLKIKDLKNMIRNLQTQRGEEVKKMGLQNVATDIRNLGQDMAASHVDRKRMIQDLQHDNIKRVKEVSDLLKRFEKEHSERKVEVAQTLESFTEDLHKEVDQFLKGVHQFMKGVHSENEQRRPEVSDLLASFKEELRKEVNKLKQSLWKENEHRQDEVGALVTAVEEMWSTVARSKGGAKKVSAHSHTETGERKSARRAKGKTKKVQSIMTR